MKSSQLIIPFLLLIANLSLLSAQEVCEVCIYPDEATGSDQNKLCIINDGSISLPRFVGDPRQYFSLRNAIKQQFISVRNQSELIVEQDQCLHHLQEDAMILDKIRKYKKINLIILPFYNL